MNEPTPLSVTVAQWLEFFIDRFKEAIEKNHIGISGELAGSFVKNIINAANGDILKIQIFFLYYGRFVDMGVSRGHKLGEAAKDNVYTRAIQKTNQRKAKKWYSKTSTREVAKLGEILQKLYGVNLIRAIETPIGNLSLEIDLD